MCQTWTSFFQLQLQKKKYIYRWGKRQGLHLVVAIFGLHAVVHLVFNKMCQAQLKSGRSCRLRLRSGLSSLNCSYCHSAAAQILVPTRAISKAVESWPQPGSKDRTSLAHSSSTWPHLKRVMNITARSARRTLHGGSPIFMTPSACVCEWGRNCYFPYLFQFMRFLYAHFCGFSFHASRVKYIAF